MTAFAYKRPFAEPKVALVKDSYRPTADIRRRLILGSRTFGAAPIARSLATTTVPRWQDVGTERSCRSLIHGILAAAEPDDSIAQRADNALQRFAVLVWLRFNRGGY